MARYLVSFDFPGIHRYVFGVDMARLVRGGSGLVDRLNRELVPGVLSKPERDIVYANGGNGIVLVEAEDDGAVDRVAEEARKLVQQESGGGLRLVVGKARYEDGNFGAALAAAIRDRTLARYLPPPPRSMDDWAGRARCRECGDEPATGELKISEKVRPVGPACRAREDEWRRHRSGSSPWARVLEKAGVRKGGEDLRPEDFQSIGDACEARRGYVAVVYADGDGIGKIVQRIAAEDAYRKFAKIVDDAIFEAAGGAIRELFGRELDVGNTLGLDVLLVGGDDLVAVIRADYGVPFALEVAKRFRGLVETKLREKGLADKEPFRDFPVGLSAGVAIAHADQPFRELVDRAEELLRSAKRKREPGRPAIDFEDVSQGHGLSIADLRAARRRTATGRKILHGERPFFLGDAEKVLAATEMLAGAGQVGRTRVNNVLSLGLAGPVAGSFELRRLLGRAMEGEHPDRTLLEFLVKLGVAGKGKDPLGWRETTDPEGQRAWTSPLADAAQLFPYARRGKEVTT